MPIGISHKGMAALEKRAAWWRGNAPVAVRLHRTLGSIAASLAVICLTLGLVGSAFDEASAADLLLPNDTPQMISLPSTLDHAIWFAIANLVVAAGIILVADKLAAQRAMRPVSQRRNRRRH